MVTPTGVEDGVPRRKRPPMSEEDRRVLGALLRDLRRAAGYRSVERATAEPGCPAARQTIYAYERGGLVPSLRQFLDLVEFYAFSPAEGARPGVELRTLAVAAVVRALRHPAYHVTEAMDLIVRLQTGDEHRRDVGARGGGAEGR